MQGLGCKGLSVHGAMHCGPALLTACMRIPVVPHSEKRWTTYWAWRRAGGTAAGPRGRARRPGGQL